MMRKMSPLLLMMGVLFGYLQADLPICTASGDQLYPDVCWDGEEFWVVWQDARDENFEIWGARVTEYGELLDLQGVRILGILDSGLVYPSIARGGNTLGIAIHFNPTNLAFVRIDREGNPLDTCFVRPVEVDDWYGYGYYDGKPQIAGNDSIFYLFSHGHSWYDWEGFYDAYVLQWKRDSIKGPWVPPREFYLGQITGTIKYDSCFVIYDYLGYGHGPGTDRVLGCVFFDTLGWDNCDTFLIRSDEELPYYSGFEYKVISSGRSGFLLVSEMSSKVIWLEILSSNGRPILSSPIIWDNGDGISQTNPSSTYGEDEYVVVWQDSSSRRTDIYALSMDTLAQINNYGYIKKGRHEEKQPSIAYGSSRYLLVWADNRDGDFDIYGMLMDSLAISIKESSGPDFPKSLTFFLSPNPFRDKVRIQFWLDRGSEIEGKVYDVSGRLIRAVSIGELKEGNHYLEWNGRDQRGREVGAGVYFIELIIADKKMVRKAIRMGGR